MRKTAITLFALALAVSLSADDRRTEHYSFDTGSIDKLKIEHAVGDLKIVDSTGSTIEIRMVAHCDSWRCDVDDAELESHATGGTLHLEADGYPKFGGNMSIDLEISMPAHLALDIERGVGETEIRGITGDIDIEAGVGEIEIEASAAAFRSADVETGVGEAELRVDGRRIRSSSSFIGEETRWREGEGQSRIDLEVGVGSAEVTLR